MKHVLRLLTLSLAISPAAHGTLVNGRFTFGGYMATERFSNTDGGSDKNDAQVLSARYFLKLTDINNQPYDITVDLRDKNDFFDKADRERLQLTDRNNFQVRELNVRLHKPNFGMQLGRFPVPEAGAAGVDGAMLVKPHTKDWRSGAFGGYNPKRWDQSYYQWNQQDVIAGAYTTYQSRGSALAKNLFLTHAIIDEVHGVQTDRFYLFHNMVYQWQPRSRLISLMYLDFVPRTYIQNGNLLWQQGWTPKFSSQLGVMAVDVITYSRRQGLREELAPSAYNEGSLRLDFEPWSTRKYQFGISSGSREADHLTKSEYYFGVEQSQFWSKRWDVFAKLGGRKNFTSDDIFANVYLGYFSRKWEFGWDVEYGIEKYKDDVTKHPLTIEFDVSNYLTRSLYLTGSVQRAKDEVVEIYTLFVKLGYRFGSGQLAPLRDGAPPRGQL